MLEHLAALIRTKYFVNSKERSEFVTAVVLCSAVRVKGEVMEHCRVVLDPCEEEDELFSLFIFCFALSAVTCFRPSDVFSFTPNLFLFCTTDSISVFFVSLQFLSLVIFIPESS